MDIQKLLSAPFDAADVEFRVGATTKDKKRGMALVYADTRAYQKRLDEVFGPAGWSSSVEIQRAQDPKAEPVAIATLTVNFPESDSWVTRQSSGTDENPMSAEARAFKRACSALGIGRYLYDSPSPWAPVEQRGSSYVFSDDTQESLRRGFAAWQSSRLGDVPPKPTPPTSNGNGGGQRPQPQPEVQIQSTPDADSERPNWRGPSEAQEWAVKIGACKNKHEAVNSWVKQVEAAWPDTRGVKPDQLPAVFDAFYARQIEKVNVEGYAS
jgi:cell division septation protein DedD